MEEKPNVHAGHRERIRERFRDRGLAGFAEHEVLELLLTYAIARRDVNPLAHELIAQFGSLAAVLEADPSELMRVKGVGESTALMLSLMPELFGVYRRSAMGAKPCISNLSEASAYCRSLFFGVHEEMVYVLCLDQAGRVIHPALLRKGSVDEVTIYPREVVETVLRYHAHTAMITHNHPGGSEQPSQADIQMTARIAAVLDAIGVPLTDHLILSGENVYSMRSELLGGMPGIKTACGMCAELRTQNPQQQEPSLGELLSGIREA